MFAGQFAVRQARALLQDEDGPASGTDGDRIVSRSRSGWFVCTSPQGGTELGNTERMAGRHSNQPDAHSSGVFLSYATLSARAVWRAVRLALTSDFFEEPLVCLAHEPR